MLETGGSRKDAELLLLYEVAGVVSDLEVKVEFWWSLTFELTTSVSQSERPVISDNFKKVNRSVLCIL